MCHVNGCILGVSIRESLGFVIWEKHVATRLGVGRAFESRAANLDNSQPQRAKLLMSGGLLPLKRDMDLLRAILIEVEKLPPNQRWVTEPLLGYSREEVVYHVKLAQDQGLVDARFAPSGTQAIVLRLTNAGHEFLDAAKNDTVWEKAKELAKNATGTLTLEALKLALPKVIEHLMKQ